MTGEWMERAACQGLEDVFSPIEGGTLEANARTDLAVHICRNHCPVLDECREWARDQEWTECVVAGERWVGLLKSYGVSRREPEPPAACPLCPPKPEPVKPPRWVRPCGTAAAYERHRRNGEIPCEPCRVAYLAYYRDRKRLARAS